MKAEHLDEQPSITNIDDELRTVLNLFGNHIISYTKNGKIDYPELFTDTIETIQNIYANKIKEAELRGRVDELQRTSRNVGAFPDDISNYNNELLGKWSERKLTQSKIDDRLTQLTNQLSKERN